VAPLDRVCRTAGYPKTIRVGQGSEFVSSEMDLWVYQHGIALDFSRPGKPTDNAFFEAFNGRFRAKCLNQNWFLTLADSVEKLDFWRRYYNEERPHRAIRNKIPVMLMKSEASPARHPERSRKTLLSRDPTLGIGSGSGSGRGWISNRW
jgi:putative transposase